MPLLPIKNCKRRVSWLVCSGLLFIQAMAATLQAEPLNQADLDTQRLCQSGDFLACVKTATIEINSKPLSKLKADQETQCKRSSHSQGRACTKLCIWHLSEGEGKKADSVCGNACAGNDKVACLLKKFTRLSEAQSSPTTKSNVQQAANLALGLICQNSNLSSCDLIGAKNEIAKTLNDNPDQIAWGVTLGCKKGHQEACDLRESLIQDARAAGGNPDFLTSLLSFSCNRGNVQACALAAIPNISLPTVSR